MNQIKKIGVAVFLAALVFAPLVAWSANIKTEDNIYIGPSEVIAGNLFRVGNIVTIEGEIQGDLFVAGNMISIKGPVRGSIFVAGNTIDISGPVAGSIFAAGNNITVSGLVGGSVRAAGNNLTLNSPVAQNLMAVGNNMVVGEKASVGWDAMLAGAVVSVNGPIARQADLAGSSVVINSEIGGQVFIVLEKESKATLLPRAKIGGGLTYQGLSEDQLLIQVGATIAGEKKFELVAASLASERQLGAMIFGYLLGKFYGFITVVLAGLILMWLSRRFIREAVLTMKERPAAKIGWGFLIFILTLPAAVLIALTVIGFPIALIIAALYGISLFLASVIVSFFFGGYIIGWFKKGQEAGLVWSLLVGALAIAILTAIPLVGWLSGLVMIWWALGGLLEIKKKYLKEFNSK